MSEKNMKRIALTLALLLVSAPVFAQAPVKNPNTVIFDHADFVNTDSYSVGYFTSATATTPVQEAPFNKPGSCAPCTGALPSRPTMFGNWWVAVRAIAGTTTSDWSSPLVPFVRAPLAPANVKIQ